MYIWPSTHSCFDMFWGLVFGLVFRFFSFLISFGFKDVVVVWRAAIAVTVPVLYVRVDSRHVSSATLEEGRCRQKGHTAEKKQKQDNNNAKDVESARSRCVFYMLPQRSLYRRTYAVLTDGPILIANLHWIGNLCKIFYLLFLSWSCLKSCRLDDCYCFLGVFFGVNGWTYFRVLFDHGA